MAAFRNDPTEWERLDWRLLQNGAVSLYHRTAVLDADIAWLTDAGYRVVRVDCGEWAASGTPHPSLARALAFADYYGANLDGLADVVIEVDVPDAGGLAIVLERLDAYVTATDRREAWAVLDILEGASRHFLLTGRRFLVLAQSDDPRLAFDSIGARPIVWNPKEWLTANRISPVT
jgi:RNAse (barnase) inhibitor barstar